jgi:hypothetical protein
MVWQRLYCTGGNCVASKVRVAMIGKPQGYEVIGDFWAWYQRRRPLAPYPGTSINGRCRRTWKTGASARHRGY